MNTLPQSLRDILVNGLGGDSWQEWVDRYEEKYNAFEVDGFDFEPLRTDYTFQQLLATTGASTLPAYVDPESPGYEAALREVSSITGPIPTMKKFYRLNRVIVRQQLLLQQQLGKAGLTPSMQSAFMSLFDESTDGLIQSFQNALTHQRHQIVSTGQMTIDSTNNPRGLRSLVIKFGIPSGNFDTLTTTARWWTSDTHSESAQGNTSDPLGYLKSLVKSYRKSTHYSGRLKLEMSKALWDDLLTHTKVRQAVGYFLYPMSASDSAAIASAAHQSDDVYMDAIKKIVRIDNIVLRDSWAYVDKPGTDDNGDPDLISTSVENFKATNIALLPEGKIGGIQGVEPITLGYEPEFVADFLDKRIKLTQRANPQTHSIYIEGEAAQLCVPTVPRLMYISTVTA